MTWDFGDGTIVTGMTNPVHVYTAPGTYTVSFIASNATCMDVKTTTITVRDLTTGIDKAGKDVFALFPNPAATTTSISLRLPEREAELVLNVLDASGKLVKTQIFNNVDRNATLQLNVADLSSGVYQILLNGGSYSTSARLNVVR
jgi:PKD repeat protein